MQSTMALLQQPGLCASKHTSRPNAHNALSFLPSRTSARRAAVVPCAFVRGTCGMPFGAGRASQQILEQMLQDAVTVGSSASRDFELPLAVDAADEGEEYVFFADIPGVQRHDLKVQFVYRRLFFLFVYMRTALGMNQRSRLLSAPNSLPPALLQPSCRSDNGCVVFEAQTNEGRWKFGCFIRLDLMI